jgi:hypothetical protein
MRCGAFVRTFTAKHASFCCAIGEVGVAHSGRDFPSPPFSDVFALGLSARSLQRLLAHESTSYFHVAESARIQNAKRWLRAGAAIEHIAEQLGYADARSLWCAFKRWTGMTPSQYRTSWQKTRRHACR